jgi:hypothetical protein
MAAGAGYLEQGQHTAKGQMANSLAFEGHKVSLMTIQF